MVDSILHTLIKIEMFKMKLRLENSLQLSGSISYLAIYLRYFYRVLVTRPRVNAW